MNRSRAYLIAFGYVVFVLFTALQESDDADQCVPLIAWMIAIIAHLHLIVMKYCCAKLYRLRRHECNKRALQLQAKLRMH